MPRRLAGLRQKRGKDIWLCGGGDLARQFLERKLVDKIAFSIISILLGDGIPLFQKRYPETDLQLIDCKAYKSGLVCLVYAAGNGAPRSEPRETPVKKRTKRR